MGDIVEELENQLQCRSCQWDKNCLTPPSMTKEEIDEKSKSALDKGSEKDSAGAMLGGVLSAMMLTGKDVECIGCPVFIKRLRQSPTLASELKKLMQEWKED